MTDSEIITPSWLDKEFLKTVLHKVESSESINILSYSAKLAVAPGNNYCCIVIRVNVEYEKNSEYMKTSLILKTLPKEGETKKMIEEIGITDVEISFYKELLPEIKKIVDKKFVPEAYFCSIPGTIILEDLNQKSYVMCDRLEQLDFDHCNIFMKTIAILHAATLYIQNEKPDLIEKIGREKFYDEFVNPEARKYFTKGIEVFASIIEDWEGFEHFAEFYRNNETALWNKAVAIHKNKKHIKVLNHGDAWTNNMLFKHDSTGKVADMMLIDFQICRFASPAIDITSFLLTSAQEEVRVNRLAELCNTYLVSFNSTLEAIGSEERLSLKQLQDELEFAELLPLYLVTGYVPIVLCERDNLLDMEKALQSWSNFDKNEKGPLFKLLNGVTSKSVATKILKMLEEKGALTSV